MTKVAIIGDFCVSNQIKETNLLKQMEKNGIGRATSMKEADYILCITCGGVGKTIKKDVDTISKLISLRKEGNYEVIVAGCLTEIKGIFNEVKDLDGVKIIDNTDWVIPVINYISDNNKRNTWKNKLESKTKYIFDSNINIQFLLQRGCINNCSFCKMNYMDRKLESVPYKIALDYLRNLIKNGTKIITLGGENTTIYGVDLYGQPVLHKLIHELSKEEGLLALNVNEITAQNMYPELLRELTCNPKVHSVSIQLESASDKLLKLMNRNHTLEEYDYIVKKLRENNKHIDTILMSGFPEETYEDLDITIKYLNDRRIETIGICEYVDFKGIIPSSNLEQLNVKEKIEHSKYLKEKTSQITQEVLKNQMDNIDLSIVSGYDAKTNRLIIFNEINVLGISYKRKYDDIAPGTIIDDKPIKLIKKCSINRNFAYLY